jgi:hypothetical protein
MMNSRKPSEN